MTDISNWVGIGADILKKYQQSESSGNSPGSFGMDEFINEFEDEFPSDPEDNNGQGLPTYSPEANRAAEQKPWGHPFPKRPKIHELNQPQSAQVLGWRILDIYLNRENKWDFSRIAGTPNELRLLIQLIQIIRRAAGETIDFEEWFDAWSHGFPDFSAEGRDLGNYPLAAATINPEKQWDRVKNRESRPRFREWTNNQDKANLGYRVIEYFPRGLDNQSYVLSGRNIDLINHIIQIEYQGSKAGEVIGDIRASKPGKIASGHPLVILQFKEILPQGDRNRPIYFEKSFRLMKLTDSPFDLKSDRISKQDIHLLATRISQNFKDDFRWKYGRKCVSYKGPLASSQGINGWAYCATQADGIALFQKIAACAGVELNKKELRYSEAIDESGFTSAPMEYQLLGKTEKAPIYRKKCDASFYDATLILPFSNQKIPLVKGSLILVP